ncbi:hypothetical protein H4219_000464 [Mycoemilia scoparia]|uniref:EF-hand domain-containing protein n=1 Tax=Mycoemilia scoparia TaxID=417184 RepID=A0A9W8DRI9_9FUNG|nr:hypothetical protein H4219_000464 [Mycoemilia scoparia]
MYSQAQNKYEKNDSVALELDDRPEKQQASQQQKPDVQEVTSKKEQTPTHDLEMPPAYLPAAYEDDFNWENASNESDDASDSDNDGGNAGGQNDSGGRKKKHGCLHYFWRMHPLLRAVVFMAIGCCLLIIPPLAIMLSHPDWGFWDQTTKAQDSTKYNQLCVARFFTLALIIYMFSVLVYHLVESVPSIALQVVRLWFHKRYLEKTRDYIEFFLVIRRYIKATLILAISLAAFAIVFPKANYQVVGNGKQASWDQVLFQINIILLFASIIIAIEKLILKVIATSFHKTAYKERIEQQKYATWVLDRLNRAREVHANDTAGGGSFSNQGFSFGSTFIGGTQQSMGSSTPYGVSSPPAESMSKKNLIGSREKPPTMSPSSTFAHQSTFGRFGSSSPNFGKGIAQRLGKIRDAAVKGGVDINSKEYAGRLARKLFGALNNARTYLIVDDFLPYFDTEADAIKAFEFFDKDGNGDISRREMRDRVLSIYRERKDLLNALHDMTQVVGKLNYMMLVMALIVIIIIALIVFALDPLKSLATLGTLFVGWSFIFGNTFKTIFECIIFLFVTHPYDPGDLIVVGLDWLNVEKVKMLSTVFYKTDGTYTTIPNNWLATQVIYNMRRSKPQSESIPIKFDFATTHEQLEQLKSVMNAFCEAHPRDYIAPINFNVDTMNDTNHVTVNVGINYKSTFQDGAKRWANRTKFCLALKEAINDLNIGFTMPVQTIVTAHDTSSDEDDDYKDNDKSGNDSDDEGKGKKKRRSRGYSNPYKSKGKGKRNSGGNKRSDNNTLDPSSAVRPPMEAQKSTPDTNPAISTFTAAALANAI